MFTGIIKELGTVILARKESGKLHLQVSANQFRKNVEIDDSIAVNGCCLTVVSIQNSTVCFDVLPESLGKTNLGLLKEGDYVNTECSMTLATKLGGHILQGHIDGTATVIECYEEGDSLIYKLQVPKNILQMLVPKGFISLDGISLTIVNVENDCFSVMIIPHTVKITIIKNWVVGTKVNLEVDIMNKTIFHYLQQLSKSNKIIKTT